MSCSNMRGNFTIFTRLIKKISLIGWPWLTSRLIECHYQIEALISVVLKARDSVRNGACGRQMPTKESLIAASVCRHMLLQQRVGDA